jgi:hypothetical protein
MNQSSSNIKPAVNAGPLSSLMTRKPVRVTFTLNWKTHQKLINRSDYEGRSLSNLVSFLVEKSLDASL